MIELRRASVADAYLLAGTRQIVWQQNFRGIYPNEKLDHYDVAAYARKDALRLADPREHYYLYLENGECVGYFSFGPHHHGSYKDFSLCLNHLYLRNDYKGHGLGKRAFCILCQYCRDQNIRKFFCGCNVNNQRAMSFYRHMGGVRDENYPNTSDTVYFEFHVGD